MERVHGRLDPLSPAGSPSDPTIQRVERPYSPLPELVRRLNRPFDHRRELVYGPPGSGKSTELLALASQLQSKYLVLFLDIRAHFEHTRGDAAALNRLHAWEVLSVVGLAIYRYGEALGHTWSEDQTDALAKALAKPTKVEPKLNVSGLASDIAMLIAAATPDPSVAVGLRALAALGKNVSASLPLGLPGQDRELPDQDERVQELKAAVTRLGTDLAKTFHRKLLLIVDGIDRGDAALARRLFEQSTLLADLPWHQVYCAPPTLRKRNVRGFDTRPICSLPVIQKGHPYKLGTGVDFFRLLWHSRAQTAGVPEALVPEAAVKALAWASGGFVRQFLEMLQDALELAWDDNTDVTLAHVRHVEDRWRRRWEEDIGLSKVHALQKVLDAKNHDDSDLHIELMDHRCIVAYPNDSMWYSPHPLLLIRMVDQRPADWSPTE